MFYVIFTTYFDVFLDMIDGKKLTIEILPKAPNLVVRKIYVAFLRYVAFRTYVRPPADWKMLRSTIQNRPRVARRNFLHKCYVALRETGLRDRRRQEIWSILIHKSLGKHHF